MDIDHELEDQIIDAVCHADGAGEPISVIRGPLYDKRLKSALGLNGSNQSRVCRVVNHLLATGLLRCTYSDETFVVGMGSQREIRHPKMTLLPA
jgi:hypothetical protein